MTKRPRSAVVAERGAVVAVGVGCAAIEAVGDAVSNQGEQRKLETVDEIVAFENEWRLEVGWSCHHAARVEYAGFTILRELVDIDHSAMYDLVGKDGGRLFEILQKMAKHAAVEELSSVISAWASRATAYWRHRSDIVPNTWAGSRATRRPWGCSSLENGLVPEA